MQIKDSIYDIRNKQVMLDSDLAELYNVSTKRLNEQVKRNIARFPDRFCFQLTEDEYSFLRCSTATSKSCGLRSQIATSRAIGTQGGRRYLPYVFTEQGIAMLSGVLKSQVAIKTSVEIMDAFVAMRKLLIKNANYFQKFQQIDQKLIEHDINFNKIFKAIELNDIKSQGIFYNGQIFDAYKFAIDLIKQANKEIILIDNYVDETTLTILSNKNIHINIKIYTKNKTKQIELAEIKFNEQYSNLEIIKTEKFHDRFLIIDDQIYHIGASLKDLGKKIFAFSKLKIDIKEINKLLS